METALKSIIILYGVAWWRQMEMGVVNYPETILLEAE